MESCSNGGQCFNPAFIHSVVIPEVDMLDRSGKVCAVARGDGVVDVIDIESELATLKSKFPLKPQKGSKSKPGNNRPSTSSTALHQNNGKRLHLDVSLGGHTAAVSCV